MMLATLVMPPFVDQELGNRAAARSSWKLVAVAFGPPAGREESLGFRQGFLVGQDVARAIRVAQELTAPVHAQVVSGDLQVSRRGPALAGSSSLMALIAHIVLPRILALKSAPGTRSQPAQ
jgi:hypothetical protein